MSSIVISGDTSGAVSIAAPAIAGTNTMTLAAATGTLAPTVLSTAVASTSGTSIDFTNIPSWVTRITIMFSGVSTSGTSNYLFQLGSGSFTTSGYVSTSISAGSGTAANNSTSGFVIGNGGASAVVNGHLVITNISGTAWVSSHVITIDTGNGRFGAGTLTLSGALDRARITTANGTDTFDAGTINIMYE